MIYILIKPHIEPSCPVDGGEIILEKAMATRIAFFYDGIKGDQSDYIELQKTHLSKGIQICVSKNLTRIIIEAFF